MGSDHVAGYNEALAQARYDLTERQGIPKGTVLLVVSRESCSHCQQSMVNTGYDQMAGKNTPIRWLDTDDKESLAMLKSMKGFSVDKSGKAMLAGEAFQGTPTTLLVKDGVIVDVVKVGQIANAREFDMLAAQSQAKDHGVAATACPVVKGSNPLSMPLPKPDGVCR